MCWLVCASITPLPLSHIFTWCLYLIILFICCFTRWTPALGPDHSGRRHWLVFYISIRCTSTHDSLSYLPLLFQPSVSSRMFRRSEARSSSPRSTIASTMMSRLCTFCFRAISMSMKLCGGVNCRQLPLVVSIPVCSRYSGTCVIAVLQTWFLFHADPLSLWSEDECQNFESGLRVHGKNFFAIHQNKVCKMIV